MGTATFYLPLLLLSSPILSSSTDSLSCKKIPHTFLEFDFLSMEFGRLLQLMDAFRLIKPVSFTGLNLITVKFGWCCCRKLGLKFSKHMKAFIQGIMKKVLWQSLEHPQSCYSSNRWAFYKRCRNSSTKARSLPVRQQNTFLKFHRKCKRSSVFLPAMPTRF